MLSCLLNFFGCKIPQKSKKFVVESNYSISDNYPNLILPLNCEDENNTILVYDSVNALLDADISVHKRFKEIIDDLCLKLNPSLLITPISYRISQRGFFSKNHVFELLNSLLSLPSSFSELSAKVELLINILQSFTGNNDESGNNINNLNIFARTIYLSLIKKFNIQVKENITFVSSATRTNTVNGEDVSSILGKMDEIAKNIFQLYGELMKKYEKSIKPNGEDLVKCISLIEEYNQISFKRNEEISELSIILHCYSYLMDEAEMFEIRKNGVKLDYCSLDLCVTNIIVYFLKFISLYNSQIYNVIFRRCLTSINLKNFHLINPILSLYKRTNFFDFDFKNAQCKFLLYLIDLSTPLCEKILSTTAFRIKNHEGMNSLLTMFRETLNTISASNINIDQNIRENFYLFLQNPENEKFQNRLYKELFTIDQIEDMILFNMINDGDISMEFEDENEINYFDLLEEGFGMSSISTVGEFMECSSPPRQFDLLLELDLSNTL